MKALKIEDAVLSRVDVPEEATMLVKFMEVALKRPGLLFHVPNDAGDGVLVGLASPHGKAPNVVVDGSLTHHGDPEPIYGAIYVFCIAGERVLNMTEAELHHFHLGGAAVGIDLNTGEVHKVPILTFSRQGHLN